MKAEIKEKSFSPEREENISCVTTGIDATANCNSLNTLLDSLKNTITLNSSYPVQLDFGYYANVIAIGSESGLAISTDGVGTKILVAQLMEKYDTIGIDCVAMNVNDILCVGAIPFSMVDYIAVQNQDQKLLQDIGKGLLEGAIKSRISIPAGEIAQIEEMIKGEKNGYGFDLVGTAVGTVNLKEIINGRNIVDGDIILGLGSSGIHSNGYTKTRNILLESGKYKINAYINELGRTLGEELLEPTHIYVPEITEMLQSGLDIKALAHITGDGFLNLARAKATCSYIIENLPETLPIFNLIQKTGNVSDKDMFKTYNMGIGFCIVVSEAKVNTVFDICKRHNIECHKLGYTINDKNRKVRIESKGLISEGNEFVKYK